MLAKLTFIITMIMFGSLGTLVKQVGMPGATISYFRGVIGIPFILICMLVFRKKINFKSYKQNWKPLMLSGICIGLNWILLFESYDYTTVSTAITMNYLAPVFVTLLAPFILKEKTSAIKIASVLVALLGVLFIGNVFSGGFTAEGELTGFLLSFGAAVAYASLIFCNKFLKDIKGIDSCIAQLVISNLVILIYVLAKQDITIIARLSGYELGMTFLIGIVFTAIPYIAYFGLLIKLKCQEISILSYLEPITAIILSAFVLKEPMSMYQIIGTVLILFATITNELFGEKKLSDIFKKTKPYIANQSTCNNQNICSSNCDTNLVNTASELINKPDKTYKVENQPYNDANCTSSDNNN